MGSPGDLRRDAGGDDGRLQPDVGHGHDLPEGTAGDGTEAEQPWRWRGVGPDQPPLRRAVQAQPLRVGADAPSARSSASSRPAEATSASVVTVGESAMCRAIASDNRGELE